MGSLEDMDGRDEREVTGEPADVGERPDETATGADPVPTFTGLFDVPAQEHQPGADAAPEPADAASPDTDSIRIIGEMFRGFRRGANRQNDLQDMLGAATTSTAAVAAGAAETQDADSDDGTDADADAEEVAHDEELDVTTPEPARPEPAPTIKTTYVPTDASDKTEQALAWLAAESVAKGQAPAIGSAVSIVPRRRRRWVGAVVAPFVTAIVLAVAYIVAFAVWPLDNVVPTTTAAEISTPTAPALNLPWPEIGEAAVLIGDDDTPLTSADGDAPLDPLPTASLAKIVTVMTLLQKQPLAEGDDGPTYEFGYRDKAMYDQLTFQGESTLPVPVGGTMTYRQMLEGILMASAGNYADKLVDTLWDYNRGAYTADALKWLQDNGLTDTNIVDPTGISPDNQSTATDLVKIAKIAMQNPVVAEIVGEKTAVLPGAGPIENSNPLLGENGVIGMKTGHLDTWSNVDYNMMTASDVPLGDGKDPLRVYAVVMGQGQPTEERPFGQESRELLKAITDSLQPVEAMATGTVVATVKAPWGASTNVIAADTASLTLFNGEQAKVKTDYDVKLGDEAGSEAGTVTITGKFGSTTVPLATTKALPRPSISWRLTHPLELLGMGK